MDCTPPCSLVLLVEDIMFYHAVHLLNHPTVAQAGQMGLHGAQVCALAGRRDAGVICTCSTRVASCPEPKIVGTTRGLEVPLPPLGNKAESTRFQSEHPNFAYLVRAPLWSLLLRASLTILMCPREFVRGETQSPRESLCEAMHYVPERVCARLCTVSPREIVRGYARSDYLMVVLDVAAAWARQCWAQTRAVHHD